MDFCSSSSTSSSTTRPSNTINEALQLNESVFEFHKPSGKPKLQIVFFHGFQLGDYEDAHLFTWKSRDGSCVWPRTWLVEEFPDAHILSITYNARLEKSKEDGKMDLHNIGENIISDLVDINIGQDARCPLILVGHSFGGIVIKQLCCHAREKGLPQHNNFLQNLTGVFFYSTPHHGVKFKEFAPLLMDGSPLLENVEILSTSAARLHDSFDNLRKVHYKHWQIEAVGESQPTQLGLSSFIIVEEASSRYGGNFCTVEKANHMTVCRPKDKTSRAFKSLTNLLNKIYSNSKISGPVHQCKGMPDYPSGLDIQVANVRNILTNSLVVGIVGMGGIGKTTIAKQLFNDISIEFEFTCFVDNVKGIPTHKLEKRVLNCFHHNGTMVKDTMEWDHLKMKKTLIVMDDVDNEDLLKVLPKLIDMGNGSRIVITSRKHDVFGIYNKGLELYDVCFLEDGEAKKLLCNHVFYSDTIPSNLMEDPCFEEHVMDIVRKCQGLPLTLEVIGGYLRSHDCNKVGIWKETRRKLEKAQSISGDRIDKVWGSLELSYNSLAPEEQEMFIEAATCFLDNLVEDALLAWSTPEGTVDILWANLKNRSLVKEVNLYGGDQIWVHEHLRDLAKKMARLQETAYSLKALPRSIPHTAICVEGDKDEIRVWHKTNDSSSYSEEEEEKIIDNIGLCAPFSCAVRYVLGFLFSWIKMTKKDDDMPVLPLGIFEHSGNLKYVGLGDILLQGSSKSFPKNVSLLILVLSPEQGPRKLPGISWKEMTKLGVLVLCGWEIPTNFLEALRDLINLRILDLTSLEGVTFLPKDFGNLSSLRELELRCLALSSLPDSFGDLHALETLIIVDLLISELPESFGGLRSLVKLNISDCDRLESLPKSFGHLNRLKRLEMKFLTSLLMLPDSFGYLPALEDLIIDALPISKLPESFGGLRSLETLKIEGCENLGELPDGIGRISSLRKIELGHCEALKTLPESLGMPLSPRLALPRGDAASSSTSKTEGSTASSPKALNSVIHEGIECDGCRMFPIEGTRFKSTKKSNYDLCSKCFEETVDDQADYVRINQLPDPNGLRVHIEGCPFLRASVLASSGWVEEYSKCYFKIA